MEYNWKWIKGRNFSIKRRACNLLAIVLLSLLLTIAVAAYSYAAEGLTLDQAIVT